MTSVSPLKNPWESSPPQLPQFMSNFADSGGLGALCPFCGTPARIAKFQSGPITQIICENPRCRKPFTVLNEWEKPVPMGPRYTRSVADPVGLDQIRTAGQGYGQVEYYDYNKFRWVKSSIDVYEKTQEHTDSMPDDGPISVAYRVNSVTERGIRPSPSYTAPATGQYLNREKAKQLESLFKIVNHEEIEGYVQAHYDGDPDTGDAAELDLHNLGHRDDRLVYLVLSGFALMMWRSQEEYESGKTGARGAPRALAWFDMRKAFDVAVQEGDHEVDHCPHRIAVQMSNGVVFFRVPYAGQDVEFWYFGIRGVIRDFNFQWINARDTPHHQEKRWPCAVGLARQVKHGEPIGERAMAVTFHCYDLDYDCQMRIGEIMMLVLEVCAGICHLTGFQECKSRDGAIAYALSMFSASQGQAEAINELFERAMIFRNNVDRNGNGVISKDEFMRLGHEQLCLAMPVEVPNGCDGRVGRQGDVCSIM